MLSTYLAAYPWLPVVAIGTLVVVGPLVAWALASSQRAAAVLAALAFGAVALLTLWPSAAGVARGCALDWAADLTAPEPLANVVLLVPATLLLAVAIRRPMLAGLVGILASAAIELVQAFVPAIGRACDLSDLVANGTGAIVGAVLAAAGLALERARTRSQHAERAGRRR